MTKAGVLRPHEMVDKSRKAAQDQEADFIEDLQKWIAYAVKAQPLLERQARDLDSGFPSGGDGGSYVDGCESCGGSGVTDAGAECPDCAGPVTGSIVERRALEGGSDHALQASNTLAHLKETVGHIRTLYAEVKRCLPDPKALEPVDGGCRSCARLIDTRGQAYFSPVYRGSWCRFCYDFQRLYRRDPPLELIDDHSRGIKMSDRRIKEAFENERTRRAG